MADVDLPDSVAAPTDSAMMPDLWTVVSARCVCLGGATGVTASVPLGGKGGLTVCCVEAAVELAAAAAVLDKAFLT